tara:strand:+ start:2592 stop:3341 length:750 start_codon:yes stop_codon:yes gene_type:complete
MFSYVEYKNIITLVEQHLPIVDFLDVYITDVMPKFCVLRHDIEFSVDRALKLARIEADELGVKSTYTVQLRNNTYNALSQKNIDSIKEIKKLGHSIGLHQNPPTMSDTKLIKYIQKDIETLEHYYGFEVDRFAFHRCGSNPSLLERYVEVPRKINCYAADFFHYFSGSRPSELNVYYIADSNHKWKYGYPLELDFNKVNKLQLLTHPYSWTERGFDNYTNYHGLIRERNSELIKSMNTETNTFPKELLV